MRCARLIPLLACSLVTAALPAFDEYPQKVETSAQNGREWLLKAQNKDGSWGMDHRTAADVSATSLAGLALLATGDNAREGRDTETIQALQKAVSFLLMRVRKVSRGHDISEGETSEFQTYVGANVHSYFAVIFLSQIYGMRPNFMNSDSFDEIHEAVQKLTDVIATSQDKDGSWHKETYASLQSTAVAWMALRSASSAGIQIKHATVEKTLEYIRKQYNPSQRMFVAREGNGNAMYDTIAAARILYGSGRREDTQTRSAVDTFLASLKGGVGQGFLTYTGEDYTASFMLSHALVQEGGKRWETWQTFVSTRLVKIQNRDGSWTATSCLQGRTVPTACALLCLHTPLRLLPLQEL